LILMHIQIECLHICKKIKIAGSSVGRRAPSHGISIWFQIVYYESYRVSRLHYNTVATSSGLVANNEIANERLRGKRYARLAVCAGCLQLDVAPDNSGIWEAPPINSLLH
jgi:hypothetical protein